MKKLLIFVTFFGLISCDNEPKNDNIGYVRVILDNNFVYEKIGIHTDFIRVLDNGDSLFRSYQVDSTATINRCKIGYIEHNVYYTTGGKTKSLEWHVSTGKTGHEEYNLQQ